MTVTFYSNYLNHLQTSFCDAMYNQLGDGFKFVSTERLPADRLQSGYQDCSHYVYNLNSFENEINFNRALQLGSESDIVIIGSASEIFVKERLKSNKITFRYYERLLKQGEWRLFDPRVLFNLLKYHTQYRNRNLFMLCASAYTSKDLNLVFAYPKKKFRWGYFTEVKEIEIDNVIAQRSTGFIEIVWTGRFIDWKHPELAVKLAYELKKKGYKFRLNMIGAGVMHESINRMIVKLNLSDNVFLLGSMPNTDVRNYMLKSNIFIFTSDRNEGWGAVLNEAMSCGCAVVAANSIGSVPYMIQDQINGLVFKSNSLSTLLKQTIVLIEDEFFRNKISRNAYYTLLKIWNPNIAATRFIKLSNSILDKKVISFDDGPCSRES